MAPSDVCPTEDAVQAFLEYLVDPLLPTKFSVPTPAQQESVAKQVHSVVLLYNYYHRKQHPGLEFLTLEEFCKLATIQKPSLLAHMKFMQKSEDTELCDLEKQLSLTEKKVWDACKTCTSLDASKNVPNIEGWPISKVAVLLIDHMKENCLLLFNSITSGVWSAVEKGLDISNHSAEVTKGTKYTYKKKRVSRNAKDEVNVDDSSFLEVGYSAIKEAAGISQTDLQVLESHTVYSQSKEKTASRFYIMHCTQPINQEANFVPIRDLIDSLQGPLVQKISGRWTITPVVEYFHVLPYAGIISEWLFRVPFSNNLQDSRVDEDNMIVDSHEVTESYVSEGVSAGPDNKPSIVNIETLKLEENREAQDININNPSVFLSQNKEKCCIQEIKASSVKNDSNGSASDVKVEKIDSMKITFTEDGINDNAACNKICSATSSEKGKTDDHLLVTNLSNTKYLEKLQILLASKDKILSETALTALIRKRNNLAFQQRMIEDQIALFDKKIQTILTGGEDDLELKIESIIEGCNDTYVRSQERTFEHLDYLYTPPCIKRRRLSEAVLVMQNQCQELDAVCHENNWILPTYHVSLLDGEFQANLTVKGTDFECSCGGNLCSSPREARESAAAQMLAKLRSMANPAQ